MNEPSQIEDGINPNASVETGQKISQEEQDSAEIPFHKINDEPSQIEDDINPNDSVSNVGNDKASWCSSTFAHLKAEAELAALTMRHKLLKEKHTLEEEEQRLRKRREELQLNTEIAEKNGKT